MYQNVKNVEKLYEEFDEFERENTQIKEFKVVISEKLRGKLYENVGDRL
jgi:hypothetical protein